MHNKHTGHTYVLEYTYNFTRTIYRIEHCLLELHLLNKQYSCVTWSCFDYIIYLVQTRTYLYFLLGKWILIYWLLIQFLTTCISFSVFFQNFVVETSHREEMWGLFIGSKFTLSFESSGFAAKTWFSSGIGINNSLCNITI